ncbi:MAG: IS4 family transposase, partial [Pirellulaceae bacterium]
FFRELAGLGGFLGRKSDGEPGWQTIWRGFDKLVPALMYAESLKRCG